MSSWRRLLWFGKEYDYHDNIGEEIVERTVRVQIRQQRRCATITCGGDGGMEYRWIIIIVNELIM